MSQDIDDYIGRCLRPEILQARAYQANPVADHHVISARMDAAESPYNPVLEHAGLLGQEIDNMQLNRYPSGTASDMLEVLRRYFQVPDQYAMLPGNGSDELIQLIATAVSTDGACALAPEPTFSMYHRLSVMAHLKYIAVPLQSPGLELDVAAMCAAIRQHQPTVIWLANPNNPTGIDCGAAAMEQIIEAAPGIVVVDEAYSDYAGNSILRQPLPPNVMVLRTLSKIGLAGLRIGVLIAHEKWTRHLDKLRLPYNISTPGQHFATTILRQADSLREKLKMVVAGREQLRAGLEQLGYKVWPSATNFLLLQVDDADAIHGKLAEQGFAVRNMHNSHELLTNCIRITAGTPQENEQLLQALHKLSHRK